jgi:hypothetical protein
VPISSNDLDAPGSPIVQTGDFPHPAGPPFPQPKPRIADKAPETAAGAINAFWLHPPGVQGLGAAQEPFLPGQGPTGDAASADDADLPGGRNRGWVPAGYRTADGLKATSNMAQLPPTPTLSTRPVRSIACHGIP